MEKYILSIKFNDGQIAEEICEDMEKMNQLFDLIYEGMGFPEEISLIKMNYVICNVKDISRVTKCII